MRPVHALLGICACKPDVGYMCLPANTALEQLDLGNKGLGVAGARALQQALVARKGLNRLILSGNQLGDEGAEAFAPAVPLIEQASLQGPHRACTAGIMSCGVMHAVEIAIVDKTVMHMVFAAVPTAGGA